MRHFSIAIWLLCASLLCLTHAATGAERVHPRDRFQPNVPPMDELEILDPRVDPEGKPRAQIVPGANGFRQIDVPPTIIVHRYYYTGDRDFQGPMLQGGPTLLAVIDPASGERVSVETLLPPGAPRITYRRDRIVYDYRDRSITMCFGRPWPLGLGQIGKPAIVIRHHSPASQVAEQKAKQRQTHRRDWWTRTGIPSATTEVGTTTKDLANNAAEAVHTVGDAATAPIKAVWRATPLSGLTSSQERQPEFSSTINR